MPRRVRRGPGPRARIGAEDQGTRGNRERRHSNHKAAAAQSLGTPPREARDHQTRRHRSHQLQGPPLLRHWSPRRRRPGDQRSPEKVFGGERRSQARANGNAGAVGAGQRASSGRATQSRASTMARSTTVSWSDAEDAELGSADGAQPQARRGPPGKTSAGDPWVATASAAHATARGSDRSRGTTRSIADRTERGTTTAATLEDAMGTRATIGPQQP